MRTYEKIIELYMNGLDIWDISGILNVDVQYIEDVIYEHSTSI